MTCMVRPASHPQKIARKNVSTLKDRLKESRNEAKLTQQVLGDRVGVPQSTIAALETGEHKTARNLTEIAAVLGVEALWLATGKGLKKQEGTAQYISHGISPHVLALAEKLSLVSDEKLKAVSILLGLKL